MQRTDRTLCEEEEEEEEKHHAEVGDFRNNSCKIMVLMCKSLFLLLNRITRNVSSFSPSFVHLVQVNLKRDE